MAISSLTNITFETLKEVVYRGAKQSYENEFPTLEKASADLKAFQGIVENRASELQHSRISIPSKEDLLKDSIEYIETFDRLYETALKAKELAGQLKEVITYLSPKPRDYQFNTMLKERGGELGEAIEKTDATCLQRVKELSDCWGKVETLQTKMMEQILGTGESTAAFSLQRFCQIVGNDGKPLSYWTLGLDKVTMPVVPKAADLQDKLDALMKEKEAAASAASAGPAAPNSGVAQGSSASAEEKKDGSSVVSAAPVASQPEKLDPSKGKEEEVGVSAEVPA